MDITYAYYVRVLWGRNQFVIIISVLLFFSPHSWFLFINILKFVVYLCNLASFFSIFISR